MTDHANTVTMVNDDSGIYIVLTLQELAAELRTLLREAERRTKRRIDKATLAKQIHISRQSLYAYLNGSTLPASDTLDALLIALGVPETSIRRLAEARDAIADRRCRRPVAASGRDAGAQADEAGGDRPGAEEPSAAPAQLPADVPAFTGRDAQLAGLARALPGRGGTDTTQDGPSPTVAVICGPAGAGKTAFAVHWAHRVRKRFPDGQLYVDLRGFGPMPPTTADEALTGFLRSLGVSHDDVPATLDARAALFRTRLTNRRVLLLLDNAADVEQVRPLLPGTPTCLAVVTSRDSLAGLVALHGAHRIDLDPLPTSDALALLRQLVGRAVDDEPEAATALVEACGHLPLALRITAELAVASPAACLPGLARAFANQRTRIDLLSGGTDPRAAVRTVLSWSLRRLSAAEAATFRLIGLHPGPDLDVHTAAELAGTAVDHTQRILDALTRAHLLQPSAPGRYRMNELLRAFAASLLAGDDRTTIAAGRLEWRGGDCSHPVGAIAMPEIVPGVRLRATASWHAAGLRHQPHEYLTPVERRRVDVPRQVPPPGDRRYEQARSNGVRPPSPDTDPRPRPALGDA